MSAATRDRIRRLTKVSRGDDERFDMEERHLVQSERHIACAEANIAKMRDLIAALEDGGRDASVQIKLLGTMLMTLAHLFDHRDLILKALSRDVPVKRHPRPW